MKHFLGVTVYTPSHILNQSHVVMMFQSGAGVEVIENEGYLSARVFLPNSFIVSEDPYFIIITFSRNSYKNFCICYICCVSFFSNLFHVTNKQAPIFMHKKK